MSGKLPAYTYADWERLEYVRHMVRSMHYSAAAAVLNVFVGLLMFFARATLAMGAVLALSWWLLILARREMKRAQRFRPPLPFADEPPR